MKVTLLLCEIPWTMGVDRICLQGKEGMKVK